MHEAKLYNNELNAEVKRLNNYDSEMFVLCYRSIKLQFFNFIMNMKFNDYYINYTSVHVTIPPFCI